MYENGVKTILIEILIEVSSLLSCECTESLYGVCYFAR